MNNSINLTNYENNNKTFANETNGGNEKAHKEKREEYYKEANRWCPEHRKKYIEHHTQKNIHIQWAENHPQEMEELITKYNAAHVQNNQKYYSQISAQQAAAQLNKEFGYGKGLIRDNPHIPEIFKGP